MKIKTKELPYEQVIALPRPAHRPPQKPSRLLGRLVRILGAKDLKETGFSYTEERMEAVGPGPWLILMNHSSFIDLEIANRIFFSRPSCRGLLIMPLMKGLMSALMVSFILLLVSDVGSS